jgi:OmcA/MtrC family decaheme c-type cytochrome
MIHRIHTGEELVKDYTVYGFGSTANNFNHVLYPGDRKDCVKCHKDGTQLLPGPEGASATVVNIAGVPVPQPDAVRSPATAACTGCHDSDAAFAHARVNSVVSSPTDWSESCSVCHGEGKDFSVSGVHASP